MGKEEKRARVQEKGKNASKSPRLKSVDSGRTNPPPPEPKVVTRNEECEHFILEVTDMADILAKIESLKDGAACEECLKGTVGSRAAGGGKEDPLKQKLQRGGSPEGRSTAQVLMCTDCQRCFCGGLPGRQWRHASKHAEESNHWSSLWFDMPSVGYCFKCKQAVILEALVSAASAMRKEEKRARVQETGKNAGKSPCLKSVDSGRTNSPPPEPKVVARNEECEHFISEVTDMADILAKIESLKDSAACEECLKGTSGSRAAGGGKEDPLKQKLQQGGSPEGRSTAGIMMCTECQHCFCSGLAGSHARKHAKKTKHWSSLWFDIPSAGYCFKCKQAVSLEALVSAASECS